MIEIKQTTTSDILPILFDTCVLFGLYNNNNNNNNNM